MEAVRAQRLARKARNALLFGANAKGDQADNNRALKTDVIPQGTLSVWHYASIIFAAMLVIWFVQTKEQRDSWNDASRLATIESLVERGTWQIDQSPFLRLTGDKIFLQGHFYSDKPPLLQVFSAVPYSVMYHILGLRLKPDACLPGEICVYKWLTFLTVGGPRP